VIVNGSWFCGYACAYDRVIEVLRKAASPSRIHKQSAYRLPLGLMLLSRGIIAQGQLSWALAKKQEFPNERIGTWLRKQGAVTESDIARAIGAQHCLPVLLDPPRQLDPAVPVKLQEISSAVCFRSSPEGSTLYIGFGGMVDLQLVAALEFVLMSRVEPCVVTTSTVAALLKDAQRQRRDSEILLDRFAGEELARIIFSYSAETGAERISIASSGSCVWVRLQGAVNLDILSRIRAD
jgi:hypothetical protein